MAQAASWPLIPSGDPWLLAEGLSWLHQGRIQAREAEQSIGNQGLPVLSLTQELQF